MQQPTAKQRLVHDHIARITSTSGGAPFRDFCEFGFKNECLKHTPNCTKVHFVHILMPYTDMSLGDCSYLNTCHRIRDGCKFVHYEIDSSENLKHDLEYKHPPPPLAHLLPAQWLECDVRKLNLTRLGNDYSVIMADPPWDIHMQLPYGTMTDDEMKRMPIAQLQKDSGFLFLWVTGRAMELARLCLEIWGYQRVDEIVWIKTNQLQRIIRTGRTGHWLNHGKEHCIVAVKGMPKNYNPGLDSDVIVAEVRETSRKPDEIYNLIERLCPGGKKLEIFGRKHNTRPGWLTLGNQLGGSYICDEELKKRLYE
ncbi:N6-adenosine-methyltransferase subunit mettl3 [Podochytrium sp. JEL0797]|nr:N6-adenosine-methyltransferase subunit mettl3 [Podochytrium sp. JEL0797]